MAREVALALYKSMWRSATSPLLKHARFKLPLEKLPERVASAARALLPSSHGQTIDGGELMRLVRHAWREGAALSGPEQIRAATDDAFACLRALGPLEEQMAAERLLRADHADRVGIRFNVGEVLRHKKFNYRAVVLGWDRRPAFDVSDWDGVVGLPSGTEQPFYRMLPDTEDFQTFCGGHRDMLYVAQENLARLELPHRRIDHPAIDAFFSRFDSSRGVFEPCADLVYEYPGCGGGQPLQLTEEQRAAVDALLSHVRGFSSRLLQYIDAVVAKTPPPPHREERPPDEPTEASRRQHFFPHLPGCLRNTCPLHTLGPGRHMLQDLRQLVHRAHVASTSADEGGAAEEETSGMETMVAATNELHDYSIAVEYSDEYSDEYNDGYSVTFTDGYSEEYSEEYSDEYSDESVGKMEQPRLPRVRRAVGEALWAAQGTARDASAVEAEVKQCFRAVRALNRVGAYVETNAKEREEKRDRSEVTYHVGQVLRHRLFGFRAAVFGWTKRPQVSVAHWEAVASTPSGAEQPFYRMVPDQNDCISLLGGPRGVRYVAQENLVPIDDPEEARLEHELLHHVFEGFDASTGSYLPVQQLAFWYPSDRTANAAGLSAVFNSLGAIESMLAAELVDAKRAGLLTSALHLMKLAPTRADNDTALKVVEALHSSHSNPEVQRLLLQANKLMEEYELADSLKAITLLDRVIEIDANFGHAYASRAKAFARTNSYAEVLRDCLRALELEPTHLSALRYCGKAQHSMQDFTSARSTYERLLDLHPWSTVATDLFSVVKGEPFTFDEE
ncbi:hypothetical protein AB1Y20_008864 [Prymnesium parvum]|uniref:Hemimethylated DNA-binding domain-containing protein n=1 Tax=Prymnesium parvum TaxID=97485 RepID=A0AB34IVS4_PRYPA